MEQSALRKNEWSYKRADIKIGEESRAIKSVVFSMRIEALSIMGCSKTAVKAPIFEQCHHFTSIRQHVIVTQDEVSE